MKVMVFALAAVVAVLAFGMPSTVSSAQSMTMEGYIIDTKCADANMDNLAEFVPSHTKACALAPACAESGYQFYSMGKLWKFDKESSDKVHEFLEMPGSTLHVSVEMMHGEGNMIKLVSVANAE